MIIQLPYDNVQMVKRKHDAMKSWHEDMAKSHATAAEWHAQQSEDLAKAMKEVPLDPEDQRRSLAKLSVNNWTQRLHQLLLQLLAPLAV